MSTLHLDSLEIKNFRCFEHLVIEKLGRVNLIVGKNSVGKTCLLEALWIFVTGADLRVIQKILYERNELVTYKIPGSMPTPYATDLEAQQQAEGFRNLFFGRPKKVNSNTYIRSGKRKLGLSLDEFGGAITHNYHNLTPIIRTNDEPVHYDWLPLPQKDQLEPQITAISKDNKVVFIPTKGLSWQTLSTFWDDIALTDMEDNVVESLRIIEKTVDKLTFKGENQPEKIRYPVIRIENQSEPLPLAALGEGMNRALGLGLAMANSSQGYLLIDEFEIGLYHGIQADMWRMIFRLAQQLDIQVVATTHSWDCVEAFQEAATEGQNEEAMLIRLQRKRDGAGIEAVSYDKRSMDIVTRQGIEVR